MDKAANIIEVVRTLVSQMAPVVTIDSVVDNGNSTYNLTVCETFWLTVASKITIDGVVYVVESFTADAELVISGSTVPVLDFFQIDAPEFRHGTHRKVDEEFTKTMPDVLPFVYLPVPRTSENTEYDSSIAYTADIDPLFLVPYDFKKDFTEDHQTLFIEPANRMADLFKSLVLEQTQNFNRPDQIDRKEWMNFGEPTRWGNNKDIFDANLSGVELSLDLIVEDDFACECAAAQPETCLPVTIYANGSFIQSVPSGGSYSYTTAGTLYNIDINGVRYITSLAANIDIPIIDEDGVSMGVISGTDVLIPNYDVNVNGTLYLSQFAAQSANVPVVNSGGVPVGSPTGLGWEVPDTTYTYDVFLNGVDTGDNITADGTDITINLGDY